MTGLSVPSAIAGSRKAAAHPRNTNTGHEPPAFGVAILSVPVTLKAAVLLA